MGATVLGREDAYHSPWGNLCLQKKETLRREPLCWSGREDLNLRPLAPHASALAGLRHAPNPAIPRGIGRPYYSRIWEFVQHDNQALDFWWLYFALIYLIIMMKYSWFPFEKETPDVI